MVQVIGCQYNGSIITTTEQLVQHKHDLKTCSWQRTLTLHNYGMKPNLWRASESGFLQKSNANCQT